jgi:hypothetical protein
MSTLADMFSNLFSQNIPVEKKPDQPIEGTGQAAYAQAINSTFYDNLTRSTAKLFADVGASVKESVSSVYQTGVDKISGKVTGKINELIPRTEQPLFSGITAEKITTAVKSNAGLLVFLGAGLFLLLAAKGKK